MTTKCKTVLWLESWKRKEGSAGTGEIPYIWISGNNKSNKTNQIPSAHMSVQDFIFAMQNKNMSISNTSACKNNTKE